MPITKRTTERLTTVIEQVHGTLMLDTSLELERHGLRYQSYCLLDLIAGPCPDLSTSDLARRTNQSKAALSDMMFRLMDRGYLTSKPAGDRRKVMINITSKGRAIVALMRKWTASRIQQYMPALTKSDLRLWLQFSEMALSGTRSPQPDRERLRRAA